MILKSIFNGSDIRGIYPEQVNSSLSYELACCLVAELGCRKVCIGHDVRFHSPILYASLISGFRDHQVEILPLGICATEEIYFSTAYYHCDFGIMITASHNPKEYNGFKIIGKGANPLDDMQLLSIQKRILSKGPYIKHSDDDLPNFDPIAKDAYIGKILELVGSLKALPSLKVLLNAAGGSAGPIVQRLRESLPFEVLTTELAADPEFIQGNPNPLDVQQQKKMKHTIHLHRPIDLGVMWDGDCDRCFFYTPQGDLISPYYISLLMMENFCQNFPIEKRVFVHDKRLYWAYKYLEQEYGATFFLSKSGHRNMKKKMREKEAFFGAETSAHYYFQSFYYCDSGILPWLWIMRNMGHTIDSFYKKIEAWQTAFPVLPEENFLVEEGPGLLRDIERFYEKDALVIDRFDGLTMEFKEWRFNLRASATEPYVRLNIEGRHNQKELLRYYNTLKKLILPHCVS